MTHLSPSPFPTPATGPVPEGRPHGPPFLSLRAARPLDAGRLGEIVSAHVDRAGWLPRVRSRAEEIALVGLMIDAGWVTVAEARGRPVGFIARDGEMIHSLFVAPAHTGQRIGSRLLQTARTASDRLLLWVHRANSGARRFYRREGFVPATAPLPAIPNDEGLDEECLVWIRPAGGASR